MSPPPELRALCHQLESLAAPQLLHVLGLLQHKALMCGEVLRTVDGNSTKSDTTETSVLVHKLKTQLSTLLHGRSSEGRLAAIVLIKAIVNVGGWEIVKGCGSWISGLLSILSKPDPAGSKRLCIITLTSIFTSTQTYQSLVREIATPNLPIFVASCLNLVVVKGSGKILDAPPALIETIFDSFSVLIVSHPTIFRTFVGQIKAVTRQYVAPTLCDRKFSPSSLRQSACRLSVLVHQSAPKNTSAEEWGRGIRMLIKEIHDTADHVFRAVVEDWESSTGHVSKKIDVNDELSSEDGDLPQWTGIDAGMERLEGLMHVLEEYCGHPTAMTVTVPIAQIEDLLARVLSVSPPVTSSSTRNVFVAGVRIHPAIDRAEREGLWSNLPKVHIASIKVYAALFARMGDDSLSLAGSSLEHMVWVFPALKNHSQFKVQAYQLATAILPLIGSSLPKSTVQRLGAIIHACIRDSTGLVSGSESEPGHGNTANADSYLGKVNEISSQTRQVDSELSNAAEALLAVLITHLPQEHTNGHLRAGLDRAAITSYSKAALLASVLQPHRNKSGQSFPSVLPHLCRLFPIANETESLLRPRFPPLVLPGSDSLATFDDEIIKNPEDEISVLPAELDHEMEDVATQAPAPVEFMSSRPLAGEHSQHTDASYNHWGNSAASVDASVPVSTNDPVTNSVPMETVPAQEDNQVAVATIHEEEDSDDESIHLVMEISDSSDDSDVE